MRERYIKKGYRSLDAGRAQLYTLIDQLREHDTVELICRLFGVGPSSYYDRQQRETKPGVERLQLKAQVNAMFNQSRSAAGSRTIVAMLREQAITIGRFKVRRLMAELGLTC